MHKILFVFLILGFNNCFAQVYDNDLELLNLKGDVKYIFYDKIYFHHNQIFDSDFSIIGHEYYLQFDDNKNLIKHGSIKEYSPNILTMYPDQKKNNKPKPNYNINGEIIDVKDYYNKGYYKNYLKSNEVFDYRYDTGFCRI